MTSHGSSRTLRRRKVIVILAAIVLLSTIASLPTSLLVAECEGAILFAWPISKGETFEISFLHSLNLSPVCDVFIWTGSEILLQKSIFKTFGAGIPIPSDGIGTELIKVEDHYELIGIDQTIYSIPIMLSDVPNHMVSHKQKTAYLLDLADSGKSVLITVRRVTLFTRLIIKLTS